MPVPAEVSATIATPIFDPVRQAIVVGEIPAGGKISEPVLAAQFGISRGPLREAMRSLEASNLVERRANQGALVITLSGAQLLENSKARSRHRDPRLALARYTPQAQRQAR